jgi:hypothetical protein
LEVLIAQQPELAQNFNGRVAWEGDALQEVLGEEKTDRCMAWACFQLLSKYMIIHHGISRTSI